MMTTDQQLVERALAAGQRLAQLQAEMLKVKAARQRDVIELRQRGWSHQRVADGLGMSRGRAQDIWKGRS